MFLDTKGNKVGVWLAKFPAIITEKLQKMNPESVIGTMNYEKNEQNSQSKITFTLSDEMLALGLPSQYDIVFNDVRTNMYILKLEGLQSKIEGTIKKECNIRPKINHEYLNFKKRLAEEKRNIQKCCETITLKDVNMAEKVLGVADIEFLSKKRKKMLSEKKRERTGSSEALNMIFMAYEESESWTVKDMAARINQPVAFTQQLMNEICILNKRDHRNLWELKPLYKSNDRN
ncbi:hypothetical protein EDEG_03016 [Edhazardia aedis USNM 41457]|uniref:Transcription initiation factor IIF subunit beta n=1 Tax=Edhazardia aedis (strain USNM 41457) TaxID=1003232 RepID=J8ZSG5_EDHAE|nr:hypothetical protein EDEG_03016 [Edhazardia aedis USNM 41457]|eukprot:EJW02583.1 hypothetical protein EDEG_03016 [Edhazardia aedis USNM 41457]